MSIKDVKAKVHLKGTHEGLEKVEGLLEGIKHRLEFLTAVELGHKLFELTEKFAHFGEELHLAADSAGVTVERLQALGYAAAQSAISQEELGVSLRVLSRSLNMARTEGGSAMKAFKDAGFDPDQVRSFKTADAAMLALADRFRAIQDPIKKSALQQELLGRGSQKMVGFLSQGSAAIRGMTNEAEELDLILSHHQVMALKDAESAIGRLTAVFKAIAGTIAAEVAPLVEHVTGEIMAFVRANRELIQVNIQNWLMDTAYTMGFIWGVIQIGIGLFTKLAEAMGFKDRTLSLAAGLVTLVSSLLVAGKVLGVISGNMTTIRLGATLLRGGLTMLSSSIISLATTMLTALLPAFTAAGTAISSFLALGAGPIALIAAAIAGLVIGIHDIYALLTGQPTWLGQFWDWLKSLEAIKSAVAWITQTWDAFSAKASGIMDKVKGIFGLGGGNVDVTQKFAQFAGGPGAPVPLGAPPAAGSTNSTMNTVQAPVTIVVPPGTPQDQVGQHVQAGVADHMDRVMRQTARSTRNAVAY